MPKKKKKKTVKKEETECCQSNKSLDEIKKEIETGMQKATEFQKKVYRVAQSVPPGKVTTYGAICKKIRCGSPRSVGQALKRNPYAPLVPCHRVIAGDRKIGGFFGQVQGKEIERKKKLLREEGVVLDSEGRIDPSYILTEL